MLRNYRLPATRVTLRQGQVARFASGEASSPANPRREEPDHTPGHADVERGSGDGRTEHALAGKEWGADLPQMRPA